MPTITGVNGNVTFPANVGPIPATNLHVFEWSADIQQEVVDDSNFEAGDNWKTKVATMHHLVGTCRGTIMSGVALTVGGALYGLDIENAPPQAGFKLQTHEGANTHAFYDFTAIISNINITMVKTDRAFMTLSFESSGDITVTPGAP